MKSITAFEAKRYFSRLLSRAARGEKIIITRHGVPTALLVPVGEIGPKPTHQEVVNGIRALRKRVKPGKMSVREMVAEGQRF